MVEQKVVSMEQGVEEGFFTLETMNKIIERAQEIIKDKEKMKECVEMRLVDTAEDLPMKYEKAIKRETCGGFSLMISCDIMDNERDTFSVPVWADHIAENGADVDEMFEIAKKRLEGTEMLCDIEEAIAGSARNLFEDEEIEIPELLVLTCERMRFGAAVIALDGMPERIAERIGGSYFVIPSSVNELLIMPDMYFHQSTAAINGRAKDLIRDLREGNECIIEDPKDFLSYGVRRYDASLGEMKVYREEDVA